jgi:hypothetical protein
MKTLLCLTFILVFSMTVRAQDKLKGILPLVNGKVTYTSVVQVDSLPAQEIYDRAKLWLIKNSEYLKLDDKDKLISRVIIQYRSVRISLILTIKIKHGRYKYEFTDFKWVDSENNYIVETDIEKPYHSVTKKYDFNYIDAQVNELITLLKNAIKTNIKPEQEEPW